MDRTEAIAIRRKAVYSLLAHLSVATENLLTDFYSDSPNRAEQLANPLKSSRVDIGQANHWLREHPERKTSKEATKLPPAFSEKDGWHKLKPKRKRG